MNRLLVNIYSLIPKKFKQRFGQSKRLKSLRQQFLYTNNGFKSAKVLVKKTYGKYLVKFNFVASIKMASKAKDIGIENTLLHNCFVLTDKFFPNRNDLKVLDVGSNFGYLASVWADSIALKGQVLAFEPNIKLYRSIEKTIASNPKFKSNFSVFNLAIGSKQGKVRLNASAFSSNTKYMSSAIESYEVNMVKLDDFAREHELNTIDLIKIDVDGIELDILKGANSILNKNKTIVIVETNNDEKIVQYFKALDYTIYDMKLKPLTIYSQLPFNIFCVPKNFENNAV